MRDGQSVEKIFWVCYKRPKRSTFHSLVTTMERNADEALSASASSSFAHFLRKEKIVNKTTRMFRKIGGKNSADNNTYM